MFINKDNMQLNTMHSFFKKWSLELAGLLIIGIVIGIDKGASTGTHVVLSLLCVVGAIDLISALLALIINNTRFKKLTILEAVFLALYCAYLIANDLSNIIYYILAPSILLGVIYYYYKYTRNYN